MSPNLTILLTMATSTVQGTAAQLESLKTIALSPVNCGAQSAQGIAWARQQKEWMPYLPAKDADVVRMLALMLMPWALQQRWSRDLDVHQMAHYWDHLRMRSPSRSLGMMIHGTRLVQQCVEDSQSNPAQANELRRVWHTLCDISSNMWRWSDWSYTVGACDLNPLGEKSEFQSLDPLYDAWIALGHIASPSLFSVHEHKGVHLPLDVEWLKRVSVSLNDLPVERHADVLLRVLGSTLPNETKVNVCKKAKALAWLNTQVHAQLRPLLPANETACYQNLPWTEVRRQVRQEQAAQQNEALAHLYCPGLLPNFSVMLRPEDWINRAAVQRAVHMGKNPGTRVDSLDVTDLVM